MEKSRLAMSIGGDFEPLRVNLYEIGENTRVMIRMVDNSEHLITLEQAIKMRDRLTRIIDFATPESDE